MKRNPTDLLKIVTVAGVIVQEIRFLVTLYLSDGNGASDAVEHKGARSHHGYCSCHYH